MQSLPGLTRSLPALTHLLLITFIEWCVKGTSAFNNNNNGTYPSYQIVHMNNHIAQLQTNFYPLRGDDSDIDPYQHIHPRDTLNVTWLNSTTNTISIHWGLCRDINITGYVKDSTVEYFPADGRFTSHPLRSNIREFTFTNLNTGTLYTICVHMNEVYGYGNSSSYSHSKCVKINTINHFRKDSVIFLLLSLGYYGFMALLGYSQWKKKQILVRARNRKRSSSTSSSSTMRWKDLVEREQLVSDPNCSIEYRLTT